MQWFLDQISNTTLVDGKISYNCSWVTNIPVNEANVTKLVKGGRAKWKIENENFNSLKNQGYHAEHNYGHGKKNLSFNFFILILLAFFMHQIFEPTNPLYQKYTKNVEVLSAHEKSTGINFAAP